MLYPKIGIRPVIDGRWGGVRESLENQTMRMAENAAKLISENLKYPDGTPVQCVIGCTTIGAGAEAARVAEQFSTQNVTATLSVTPCWCYGTETFDMDPNTIKAVWGFNGTERPGAVYLAAVLAAHAQRGLPAFSIYGHDVQEANDDTIPDDVAEKILRFARGAVAAGWMKNKAYVNIGAVTMGIAGSFCDAGVLQKYFGIRAEWVDEVEILRRISIGIYDHDEYEKALAWVRENCKEGFDKNLGKNLPPVITKSKIVPADKDWEFIVKMTLIIRDILYGNPRLDEMGWHEEALGRNAVVGGFQGQRHWTDFYPNGDIAETLLNSTFDWNGPRAPLPFATENDSLNGACLLFGYLLTGQANVFADVRTYWSPEAVKRVTGYTLEGHAKDGIIHLINSGSAALDGCMACTGKDGQPVMKKHWDVTPDDAKTMMEQAVWCPANREYFRGGGYSVHYVTRGGAPVTMMRLNIVKGLGPVLIVAEGWSVDLPAEVHKTLDERTDPGWPTTWFAPRLTGKGAFTDVYSVMANMGANHGAFTYGHIGADILTLASMLRIPVYAHNIPDDQIYRPSAWGLHGTADPEGADFRACANYGPLYGKY